MSADAVWQLKIPVRLSLAQSEISTPVDVKPVYLLAPRHAYLPALAQQCLAHFQHVLLSLPGQTLGTPWLEAHGLALDWTQPLGVIFDLLSSPVAAGERSAAAAAADAAAATGPPPASPALPWRLTVHYRNAPPSAASSWQNPGSVQQHYFSSLKEAGYCCRGTDGCGAVMRLPGQQQDELWAAVNRGDGSAVRQQLASLRMVPTPRQGGVACVPVRLYIRRHTGQAGGSAGDNASFWQQVFSTSRPVEVLQPDGSPTLLAHLVHLAMPAAFPAPVHPAAAAAPQQQQQQEGGRQQHDVPAEAPAAAAEPQREAGVQLEPGDPLGVAAAAGTAAADDAAGAAEAAEAAGGQAEPPPPAAAADEGGDTAPPAAGAPAEAAAEGPGGSRDPQAVQGAAAAAVPAATLPDGWPAAVVLVCGIQPDWCTPLGWLHANLRAADAFLYVVVHLPSC